MVIAYGMDNFVEDICIKRACSRFGECVAISTLSLPWHGIHVKLDHQNAGCAFWRFVREV